MSQFIIHIGAPRTGTTVLQQHIFPQLKTTLGLIKRPFKASLGNPETVEREFAAKPLDQFTISEKHDLLESRVMPGSIYPEENVKQKTLDLIKDLAAQREIQKILISSELLCDNPSSLNCHSRHQAINSNKFYIYNLIHLFSEASITPTIAICLRDPIPYLASKYLRTVVQRENRGERFLSPFEFIEKQACLENSDPGSSALTPAFHKRFLDQLSEKANVIGFGFQELISSNDVFKLFQLKEPAKLAFKDYPRENSLRFNAECKRQAQEEIRNALYHTGIIGEIERNQLYL